MVESDIDDLLRVVDASPAPPTWMGPVDAAAQAEKAQQIEQLLGDYGKLVDDLADVVFVVEGRRFPVYRGMLSARSEYFLGQFLRGRECLGAPCSTAVLLHGRAASVGGRG